MIRKVSQFMKNEATYVQNPKESTKVNDQI